MKHIHTISFKHAGQGLCAAFRTQPNFRIHAIAAVIISFLGYQYSLSTQEWLILILTIGFVIATELINTAIESVVDLLTQQHNQYAKTAKDVAAAAVLFSAMCSVIIGLIIFLPKII
jgi:undecaprenol kinase